MIAKVFVQQPNFLPWIGFWNKVVCTDMCILLGKVQYTRGDFINRVLLDGKWLTVPIIGAQNDTLIEDCKIDSRDVRKIGKTLRYSLCSKRYKFAERIDEIVSFLESTNVTYLCDLNFKLLVILAKILDLKVNWEWSKELIGHNKTDRLQSALDVVSNYHVEYFAGMAGLDYLDVNRWAKGVIWGQDCNLNCPKDTILKTIVTQENPVEVIKESAKWKKLC